MDPVTCTYDGAGMIHVGRRHVEEWRDNPSRFLSPEPDPKTGTMRPVTKRGRPVYLLYLSREERETR